MSQQGGRKAPPVNEWLDAEGIKYLVLAVIGLGGVIGRILLGRLDDMASRLETLHDDMVRVKTKLGIGNGST